MRILLLTILLLSALATSSTSQTQSNSDFGQVLDSLEAKYDWLEYRIALERWEKETTGQSDSLDFFAALFDRIKANPETYRLLKASRSSVTDRIDRRRLDIFEGAALPFQVEASRSVSLVSDSLSSFLSGYSYMWDGATVSRSELERHLKSDRSRTQRELAMRALASPGDNLASPSARLFRLRNQQAKREGYNSYLALLFSRSQLSLEEYCDFLDELDSLTAPAFRALKARLDGNDGVLEYWDLCYRASRPLVATEIRVDSDSVLESSLFMFNAIGFEINKLPIFFARGDSDITKFMAIPVHPPNDLRIVGYPQTTWDAQQEVFAELGQAVYAAHIRSDEPLFSGRLSGPMQIGIGQFFARFASSERWLTTVLGFDRETALRHSRAESDVRLIELRQLLVDQYFEIEAYRNSAADMTQVYWDLCQRLLDVPRHDDLHLWASKAEVLLHPTSIRDRLIGLAIAAQTFAYLEKVNGTVIGNRDTRAFLVENYFRFGRRYPWSELLERGTGESITPLYLAESFSR